MTRAYDKIQKALKLHMEALKLHQEAAGELSSGPASYYFDKLDGYMELLFSRRCAPFLTGDRVELIKDPDINPDTSWGWMGAKHFLIVGAKGTVKSVDASRKGFAAMVEFDDESYIHHLTKKPVLVDPKDRHVYGFREEFLKRLEDV